MIRREYWPVLGVNLGQLGFFTIFYVQRGNGEFLLYIGIIVLLLLLIAYTDRRVLYPPRVIWGLTLWAFLHMAGGGFRMGDDVLYNWIIVPLSDQLPILKFDQVVHAIGFGVATMLMYHLLTPLLKPVHRWTALSIVVVMAGLGVGAFNEIVEFAATQLVPETNVGGYVNTALDLVFNGVGAVVAMAYIRWADAGTPGVAVPEPAE